MKKIFIGLTVIVCMLSACSQEPKIENKSNPKPIPNEVVKTLKNVTLNVKEETVTSTGLTLTIENETNESFIYGQDFSLEQKRDDKWKEVPTLMEDYGFHAIGYNADSLNIVEWKVDWEWLYGSLSKGNYRITKSLTYSKENGTHENYLLTAEFEVK